MTVDRRLEFLLQSTESLRATSALHSEQIQQLTGKMQAIAETMSELALAVLDQERRLGSLDGAQ